MKKMLQTVLLFLTMFVLFVDEKAQTAHASPQESSLNLGIIKNHKQVGGYICSVYRTDNDDKHGRYLFHSGLNENNKWKALINLDGVDLKLNLVRRKPQTETSKIGDRLLELYSAHGVTVRVDYVITWLCPPRSDSCEIAYHKATLTVKRGGQTKTIRAKGACGS